MGVVVYPVCDAAPVIKGKASEEMPVFFLPLFSSFSSLFFFLSLFISSFISSARTLQLTTQEQQQRKEREIRLKTQREGQPISKVIHRSPPARFLFFLSFFSFFIVMLLSVFYHSHLDGFLSFPFGRLPSIRFPSSAHVLARARGDRLPCATSFSF